MSSVYRPAVRVVCFDADVQRDTWWKGRHMVGPEQFFVARYATARPEIAREGLLGYELADLIAVAWVHPDDVGTLPDRLEPPDLAEVFRVLPS